MAVYKDGNTNKWKVYFRYTNWQGIRKVAQKRGFRTKKEAKQWETIFLAAKTLNVDMMFDQFVEIYLKDLEPRLKYNTFLNKKYVINSKIILYFKNKTLSEITASDVIQWQNLLLSYRDSNDRPYSPTYLRAVQNQLSAIFNHACNFYNLKDNPSRKAGKMGKKKSKEMLFWTKDEYLKFSEVLKDKPQAYYAFQLLFWCGLRTGELLALTPADIDYGKKNITINKSYQRLEGKDYITCPKTEKSNRLISMPDFLVDMLKEYVSSLYGIKDNDRLFPFTKSYLHKNMTRYAALAGVKRIRIHDLRHSHVAYLIELGFSPVAIAERLGHESIEITYNYAHLYPSKQNDIANKLNKEIKNKI